LNYTRRTKQIVPTPVLVLPVYPDVIDTAFTRVRWR